MEVPTRTEITATLLAAALAFAAGCTSQTTRDLQQGPKFTEAQKDAMADEEKLAIYNSLVREKDQLHCKRVQRVGSRIKDLVCKTEAEVSLQRVSAREALRQSRGDDAAGGQ